MPHRVAGPDSIAVVVVDLQEAMFDGLEFPPVFEADRLERRAKDLLAWARRSGIKIAFVRHDGPPGHVLAPGAPGWGLRASLDRQDDEPIFAKTVGNAFTDPSFRDWIDGSAISKIILLGAQTDQCVALTHAGALEHGLSVIVVADAHSTWDSNGQSAENIIEQYNHAFEAAGSTVVLVARLIGG
jgi:nicotinamidase-related amidase